MGLVNPSWQDIDAARGQGLIALLPVGALEQHGPHLPLDTDTILASGVARRIADRLGAWLLPAVTYGEAWTAEAWPGTISLTADTLRAVITDIGRGVQRIGCFGLVTVNGHFGNRGPIERAAHELLSGGGRVLQLDYPGLEAAAAEHCVSTPAGPGFYHADEVETSMMLALAPEAVRMELAMAEYPTFPPGFGRTAMQLRTFNQTGVFGDPRPATAATGEKLIVRIVDESIRLIEEWRT